MVDVTVFGAGVFGLSVAWACLRRGARVRVIDPNGIASGASGGVVGALAPHVPENWNDKKQFQFESLVMAQNFWAEVTETAGEDAGYARSGRLQPILDEGQIALAEKRVETAKTLWQGQFHWQLVEAVQFGDFAPSPTGLVIKDSLSARIHPRRATHALAKAIQAKGGEICDVGKPEGAIIWATGVAGLEALSNEAGRPAGLGVKGQAALLDFDGRGLPQLFADTLHIIPHNDGTTAIGSTSETSFSNPSATDDQIDAIIARARLLCPALKQADVLEKWAGLRPRARSRAPLIGRHPYEEHTFLANGGFKIGFGMAPKVGEVMADLILKGEDNIPPSFKPEASL